MSVYLRPATLTEAISGLTGPDVAVLAGGTDLYPMAQGAALHGTVVDIAEVPGLRGISAVDGSLRIGACTTWTDVMRADLPPALSALQTAARQVGGWQIQNAGTVGGNLCNASPAADGVPPLLACEAQVEVAGPDGVRRMHLSAFITGPRRTALGRGEILVAVVIPAAGLAGRSAFLKLGARAHLVISIAMVAVRIVVSDGIVTAAALAVGSASPVARRLPGVEAALLGVAIGHVPDAIDAGLIAAALTPIDDIRATAAYRVEAAVTLLRRAVAEAVA